MQALLLSPMPSLDLLGPSACPTGSCLLRSSCPVPRCGLDRLLRLLSGLLLLEAVTAVASRLCPVRPRFDMVPTVCPYRVSLAAVALRPAAGPVLRLSPKLPFASVRGCGTGGVHLHATCCRFWKNPAAAVALLWQPAVGGCDCRCLLLLRLVDVSVLSALGPLLVSPPLPPAAPLRHPWRPPCGPPTQRVGLHRAAAHQFGGRPQQAGRLRQDFHVQHRLLAAAPPLGALGVGLCLYWDRPVLHHQRVERRTCFSNAWCPLHGMPRPSRPRRPPSAVLATICRVVFPRASARLLSSASTVLFARRDWSAPIVSPALHRLSSTPARIGLHPFLQLSSVSRRPPPPPPPPARARCPVCTASARPHAAGAAASAVGAGDGFGEGVHVG